MSHRVAFITLSCVATALFVVSLVLGSYASTCTVLSSEIKGNCVVVHLSHPETANKTLAIECSYSEFDEALDRYEDGEAVVCTLFPRHFPEISNLGNSIGGWYGGMIVIFVFAELVLGWLFIDSNCRKSGYEAV